VSCTTFLLILCIRWWLLPAVVASGHPDAGLVGWLPPLPEAGTDTTLAGVPGAGAGASGGGGGGGDGGEPSTAVAHAGVPGVSGAGGGELRPAGLITTAAAVW
jgi:hypothetical protein